MHSPSSHAFPDPPSPSLTCTGSDEEVEDLKAAYLEHDGSLDAIMAHIPHSTFDDETRFIVKITSLVASGDLPKSKTWEKSTKDEKAKLVRQKQADKEAAEAEDLAKELGVWDEFYGCGKPSSKKGKGKGKGKAKAKAKTPAAGDKPKHPPLVSVAAVVGGMSAQKQRRILSRGVDVLVATPGRLWDILQEVCRAQRTCVTWMLSRVRVG